MAVSATTVSAQTDPLRSYLMPEAQRTEYEIIINLPALTLSLYHRGALASTYPIAIGSQVAPSQLGTTHIINKVANPTYYPPDWGKKGLKPIPPGPENPVGTRWLGLDRKGYGIHGTNNPASIGSAASSGCIRMYNSDVEKLTDMVSIGTPVTFVYETTLVGIAPGGTWPYVQVFKDIYNMAPPTVEGVAVRLAEMGFAQPVHAEALQMILNAANGKPEPLPIMVAITYDSGSSVTGYFDGMQVWAPVRALAEATGNPSGVWLDAAVWVEGVKMASARVISGKAYAPLTDLARSYGLMLQGDGYTLAGGRLVADGVALPGRLWQVETEILVPLEPFAVRMGMNLAWDKPTGVVYVGDKLVAGTVHAGRLYAAQEDILAAFPQVAFVWNCAQAELELILPESTPIDLMPETAPAESGPVEAAEPA